MRTGKLCIVVVLFALCISTGTGNARTVSTEVSAPSLEPIVSTQAESMFSFGVYLDLNDTVQKITTVEVDEHVNTLTVQTSVAPNGAYVSVIPNFDTIAGTDLRIYDVQSGQENVIVEDRVTSVAWLPTSKAFAYGRLTNLGAEIYVSTLEGDITHITTIEEATEVELIGWSNDGNTLYFVYSSYETGFPMPVLAQFDVTTQTSENIFVSQEGTYYKDFRLIGTSTGHYISFIRSDVFWMCGAATELVLAKTDGSTVAAHVVAEQAVSQSVWHPDGDQVAFATRDCPSKDQKASNAAISEGVFVADVTTEQEKQVVATGLVDYELSGFSDKELLLTSERFGNHQLDTAGPTIDTLPAITLSENLQSDTPITIQGRTNWVPYVHQLWSTPEWFNGSWACGPTSSVMAVAHYRLPANRIWVLGQPSDYGFYVPEIYTYNSVRYAWTYPDASGRTAWGAYGYIVGDPGVAYWNLITAYLNLHNVGLNVADGSAGSQWVRDRINEGKVVVTSGDVFGYGHIIVIRGYTDDGRFVVNDPYGNGTQPGWGNHNNGGGAIYTWGQISPKYFWAVAR